jgi:hypothetical protein
MASSLHLFPTPNLQPLSKKSIRRLTIHGVIFIATREGWKPCVQEKAGSRAYKRRLEIVRALIQHTTCNFFFFNLYTYTPIHLYTYTLIHSLLNSLFPILHQISDRLFHWYFGDPSRFFCEFIVAALEDFNVGWSHAGGVDLYFNL